MQFGERLKELRSAKGMTQKDLAEKINISPQAVSRWENNEVEPSLETLRRLAEIFDVSMDDLFGKEKKPEAEAPAQPAPEQKVLFTVCGAPAPSPYEKKPVLAVCEACNTPIYDKEKIFRFTDQNGQKTVYCQKCHRRKTLRELQEKRCAATVELDTEITRRKRGYIFGALIGIVIFLIGIISAVATLNWVPALVCGILGTLAFMGFFCVFAGDSVIGEMGAGVMGWSFHAPGIIFEWSAEGIADLIVLKIIFWLIGLLVGICTFCLGIAVILVCAPFAFPYDVYAVNRDIRNLQEKLDSTERELKKFETSMSK